MSGSEQQSRKGVTQASRRLKAAAAEYGAELTHMQARNVLARALEFRDDHAMMQAMREHVPPRYGSAWGGGRPAGSGPVPQMDRDGLTSEVAFGTRSYRWHTEEEGSPHRPLTLICAPAGGGKSLLLHAQAQEQPQALLLTHPADRHQTPRPDPRAFTPSGQFTVRTLETLSGQGRERLDLDFPMFTSTREEEAACAARAGKALNAAFLDPRPVYADTPVTWLLNHDPALLRAVFDRLKTRGRPLTLTVQTDCVRRRDSLLSNVPDVLVQEARVVWLMQRVPVRDERP